MAEDPFEHVVVLMMENRSFDHILGALFPAVAGVDPANPGRNTDDKGTTFAQEPNATAITSPDPGHDTSDVLPQIANNMSGFVLNYAHNFPSSSNDQRQQIMSYFADGTLMATQTLAKHFTVCDHWFCSVPGPTWTNRFFVHSGTSIGRVKMPSSPFDFKNIHIYSQTTLYDQLNKKGISWRIYSGDIPQSIILTHQWRPQNAARYSAYSNFRHDVGIAGSFPQYVFIEPKYMSPANDDHPDHSVFVGETLIADVYNTLRGNDELWKKTLLVLLFDEHGGFYDHIPPGPATPPDNHKEEYTFDRFGVRVPAILISDRLAPGAIVEEFDHTSLLAYLIRKWGLNGLGARTANAKSPADFWTVVDARDDTPEEIVIPSHVEVSGVAAVTPQFNENQRALMAMAGFLEELIPEPPLVKAAHLALAATSPEAHAIDAVNRFIEMKKQE